MYNYTYLNSLGDEVEQLGIPVLYKRTVLRIISRKSCKVLLARVSGLSSYPHDLACISLV